MSINQNKKLFPTIVAALLVSVSHNAMAISPYTYSPEDVLNGDSAIIANAKYNLAGGKGIVVGDVDTGIVPSIWFNPSYNGQGLENVSTTAGVCLNTLSVNQCRTVNPLVTPTDQNSHGTFTASEMVGGAPAYGYNSMAPGGTVLSVQVLNAQGSGNSTDVANGITYAVSHGAQVINLSLGPSGTAAQQAAFYQSLSSAINYAASQNVYVVFAAGNSSQPFSNGATITGFTNSAIQHMLIMGSTTIGNGVTPTAGLNVLSTFSDSAGTGKFISTTGQTYNVSSIFMVADGENIWGASNSNVGQCRGYGCIQQDSGTSMSAPQGTAAIALLEKEWPILKTNGMAAAALESNGINLGASSIYGDGYLNLIGAFQPIGGTYTVTNTGNVPVNLNSGGSSILSGGALGSLSSLSSHLANYTVFDSLGRNFTVNLSSMVATQPSMSNATASTIAPKTSIQATHFADGSSLALGSSDNESAVARPTGVPANTNWFMSFTDAGGSTMAAGSGFPASASFADALWGAGSVASAQTSALGISNALLNLAEGGQFVAFGTPVDAQTRVALSWTQSQAAMDPIAASDWTMPNANAFSAGITTKLAKDWTGGATFGVLNEQNAMLGTTYVGSGSIGLGDNHRSMSFGLTSEFSLGEKLGLMVDAAIARVDSAALTNSLITDVSSVYARSFGAALTQRDALNNGDNVSLSLRAPLTVFSGSASLATDSVDSGGNPIVSSQNIGLKPNGNEFDFVAGYQAPITDHLQWNVMLEERRDADNMAGVNDTAGRIGMKYNF
jgi:hypothetical protein